MVVKTVSIFYICCMMLIISSANELASIQPSVHSIVAKIKHATPVQKRLLLDALKVQLRTSQKKIRRQVMIEFIKGTSRLEIEHGVKFD